MLTDVHFLFISYRTDKVPHNDGCEEGLDAWYVL